MYKNIFKYDDMKRAEHMAVRNTVGWYFWTHQLLEITGSDRHAFLEHMFAGNVSRLAVGRDRYTTMLDENGQIIDDVVIMRRSENVYWVSTLFATKTDDCGTSTRAITTWSGRRSPTTGRCTPSRVPSLGHFWSSSPRIPWRISSSLPRWRRRSRGSPASSTAAASPAKKLGYEIYVSPEHGEALEALLAPAAQALGGREVTEFQVMAWTLPTEAGFYYMRDLAHTNPFEVGLDRASTGTRTSSVRAPWKRSKPKAQRGKCWALRCPRLHLHPVQTVRRPRPGCHSKRQGNRSRIQAGLFLREGDQHRLHLAKKGVLKPGDHLKIHGHEAVITEKNWL